MSGAGPSNLGEGVEDDIDYYYDTLPEVVKPNKFKKFKKFINKIFGFKKEPIYNPNP